MFIDIQDLSEEITLDIYPIVSDYGYLSVNTMSLAGYVTIGDPVKVTFKTKSTDEITGDMVDALKAEASKIRADAEVKIKDIDEKIQSLLALPSPNNINT